MKKNKKLIGVYELLFGAIGVILAILSIDPNNSIKLQFSIFSLLIFGSILIAGILLLNEKKIGIPLSNILQSLQIVSFNIFGVKYIFCCGSKFNIDLVNLEIDFALLMNEFVVGLNVPNDFFGVNLIPIFILVILNKYSKLD